MVRNRCGKLLVLIVLTFVPATLLAQMAGMSAPPKSAPVRFPEGQHFVRLPMQVLANGPYVQVKVNGRGPFNLEVDTGSMDSPFASELAGELGFSDPDGASQTATIALGDGVEVSIPASFVSFAGLWPLTGRHVYGALGYPVLRNFVVEFDYEAGTLTLYDPREYHYRGAGQSFPATLEMGYDPQIAGTLHVAGTAPIAARLTLDTGAGGTVISSPLVRKHGLMTRVTRKVPNPPSKALVDGVDGAVFDTVTGRIDALTIGRASINAPLVALSNDRSGTFAMGDIGVNLGGNILRRFKVIIDYPQHRVIFEPNSHLRDPFPADASGLVLTAEGSDFKRIVVHGVVANSPASESGVKEGDVITSIDGISSDQYALWQIQDLLRQSGKEVSLTIERGGEKRTVTLKLRALA